MRFNGKVLTAVIALALIGVPAYAQVQSVDEIETPTPQFQDHGGVTPWFWIGVQTVFGAGYNMETGAGGFRNYGGDNNTYASFNLAFVDSHYQTNKFYEVPKELDPDAWTGHFVMMNFTTRANSWEGGATGWENNAQAWLAEITGKGVRIGFFTQAGNLIGGIEDPDRTSAPDSKPITRIFGGNKVLNLGAQNELGKLYYEKSTDSNVVTEYSTNDGAIMYAGYEKKELWNVYLTMLSEGNVNTPAKNSDGDAINKGFAGVIDFGVTPFGIFTDEETPITVDVTGNVIGGFGWINDPLIGDTKNVGFGLKTEGGFWLGRENFVLSPLAAFDMKIDDAYDTFWKVGGGLTFRFSGMRWASDEWGDLYNGTSSGFADMRYENNKILKYAYAQAYAAFSEERDLNLLFRAEEPDGNLGFHDKLGAMVEARLYNLMEKTTDLSWEAQARVSWDFNIGQYLVTPYLRGYLNKAEVVKFRAGAYANFIPFTGFELAYTSANLNPNADTTEKPMGHYDGISDIGRVELLIILKSDEIRPVVPKRMSDWNYPETIQDY